MKKIFIQQNMRKKSLDPYKNREAVQRDLESGLFLLNVYGRRKSLNGRLNVTLHQ